jgi:ribosomal protein S18 acetylase RimI-like enzyme
MSKIMTWDQAPNVPLLLESLKKRPIEKLDWSFQNIQSHLKRHPALVSLHNSRLQALILFIETKDVVEIGYLETLKDWRRQGVMEALLKEWMVRHSGKTQWLEVHANNLAAIALYEKLGFIKRHVRPQYYRDGGDCWLLEAPTS